MTRENNSRAANRTPKTAVTPKRHRTAISSPSAVRSPPTRKSLASRYVPTVARDAAGGSPDSDVRQGRRPRGMHREEAGERQKRARTKAKYVVQELRNVLNTTLAQMEATELNREKKRRTKTTDQQLRVCVAPPGILEKPADEAAVESIPAQTRRRRSTTPSSGKAEQHPASGEELQVVVHHASGSDDSHKHKRHRKRRDTETDAHHSERHAGHTVSGLHHSHRRHLVSYQAAVPPLRTVFSNERRTVVDRDVRHVLLTSRQQMQPQPQVVMVQRYQRANGNMTITQAFPYTSHVRRY